MQLRQYFFDELVDTALQVELKEIELSDRRSCPHVRRRVSEIDQPVPAEHVKTLFGVIAKLAVVLLHRLAVPNDHVADLTVVREKVINRSQGDMGGPFGVLSFSAAAPLPSPGFQHAQEVPPAVGRVVPGDNLQKLKAVDVQEETLAVEFWGILAGRKEKPRVFFDESCGGMLCKKLVKGQRCIWSCFQLWFQLGVLQCLCVGFLRFLCIVWPGHVSAFLRYCSLLQLTSDGCFLVLDVG